MTTTTDKKRTITLTGRRPVTIRESEWPVLASASGDSFGSADYSRHQQALGQGELDTYRLTVRQHADGRTLVYGVLDAATAWTHSEDHRGGELLDGGANVAEAIQRIGEECGLPDSIIRECVADLPAEEI